MLRVHLLQQWYSLSDPEKEEAYDEVLDMHRFAGIELISDRIPVEIKILMFRYLMEMDELGERAFKFVKVCLNSWVMTMRQGTIVDSILIAAPSLTKNKDGSRIQRCTRPIKATTGAMGR